MEIVDMKMSSSQCVLIILLSFLCGATQIYAADIVTCFVHSSPCFAKPMICPGQCPSKSPLDPKAQVCYINCNSPICKAECKKHKPNCNSPGAACLDPRFIGGDSRVFYFHGKSNEHFSLVSDPNLQINARFIGHRPAGRSRDYTWIQALGLLFDSKTFTVEATRASTWDDKADHLSFSYNGQKLEIPEYHQLGWTSEEKDIQVERTSDKNSAVINVKNIAEISVNVVPITKEDDRIHNYQIPYHKDCFAHLEVQFKFFALSADVEGVLGRTYQPDFKNPAKPGVAMAIVGGEDRYRTTSLVTADCGSCKFEPNGVQSKGGLVKDYSKLDCTGGAAAGNGIVCRK